MWSMIKSMKVEKQDYLQVFELKKISVGGKEFQQITHSQEQPKYKNTIFIPVEKGGSIENKIFVIDDFDYCTMLLAEEY